ncbi:MAG TPA: hypothetical protein VKU00_27400 [Chthonomonadaceae bacterium]|nr:hypothetical protein [Chthonomonadaceae bacterium]
MANLWVEQDGKWGVLPLEAERYVITGERQRPVAAAGGQGPVCGALLPVAASGTEWALLCPPGACRVNGEPVSLGIRALRDRDEIGLAGGIRLFFSSESLARVAPFAGADQAIFCPRCCLEIAPGVPAVVCPGCGTTFHQDEAAGLPCFTYGVCTICGLPGALDSGFRWIPQEL